MISDEEIQTNILHKLFRKKKWGGAHISYDKVKRWVTEKQISRNGKRVDESLRKLIREGLIISKPTHYGIEISLNPRFSSDILNRIKKFYPPEEEIK